jgi:ubiquinone/menaquinone biosynthesis C-methylase UbiE
MGVAESATAPMDFERDHNQIIQEAFTRQAAAYAANSSIADPERIARLVRAVNPRSEHRVLEVATGPGYVALAIAAIAREVIGIDLTGAPLAIAEQRRRDLQVGNVRFQTGNASHLPFADGEFDIVVCRFAFHHFDHASQVLREMTRLCAPRGLVAVEDLVVSDHPARAAYQNHFEQLRDPSHVAAFSLRALLALITEAGLEVEHVSTDQLIQPVERWLANAQTPADKARQVRRLIERDAVKDLSGTCPFQANDDRTWCFIQRTAIVAGRTLPMRRL